MGVVMFLVPARAGFAVAAIGLLAAGAFIAFRRGESSAPASVPEEEVQVWPNWLGAHQSADGRWEAAGYDTWQMGERVAGNDPAGHGKAHNDVAVTALAVIALTDLGYGRDGAPSRLHPNDAAAMWGRQWLRSAQREDGSFAVRSNPSWATNHALAMLALAESAEWTRDERDAEAARRALWFRHATASERAWHDERGPGDVPPIAWLALAHRVARGASGWAQGTATGLADGPVLERDRREVVSWVTSPEETWTVGRIGASLAAARPWWPESERPDTTRAETWLAERAPRWHGTGAGVDFGGWWLGTMGALATGGDLLKTWDAAIRTAVADTQRSNTGICDQRGSWDAIGVWADEGGRVFTTAAGALILGIYYRYDDVVGAHREGGAEIFAPLPRAPRSRAPSRDLPLRRYPACR
jgi:hypothetical protein